MKTLGNPCGGCCTNNCSTCCSLDSSDTYEVDLTLTDDECGVCDSFLSGTYSLNRVGQQCSWRYVQGNALSAIAFCDSGCTDVDLCAYVVYRELFLTIQSVSSTKCAVDLQVVVGGRYYPSQPGNPCNTYLGTDYRKFINFWNFGRQFDKGGLDCVALSSYALPLYASGCKCMHLFTDCDPSYMRWLCDASPVDAEVTSA